MKLDHGDEAVFRTKDDVGNIRRVEHQTPRRINLRVPHFSRVLLREKWGFSRYSNN
jgi:hypothetical protein